MCPISSIKHSIVPNTKNDADANITTATPAFRR